MSAKFAVVPAEAGTQSFLDSCLRGNDDGRVVR